MFPYRQLYSPRLRIRDTARHGWYHHRAHVSREYSHKGGDFWTWYRPPTTKTTHPISAGFFSQNKHAVLHDQSVILKWGRGGWECQPDRTRQNRLLFYTLPEPTWLRCESSADTSTKLPQDMSYSFRQLDSRLNTTRVSLSPMSAKPEPRSLSWPLCA